MRHDVIASFSGKPEGILHEAYLSTIENAPQAHARLSRAHENKGGTCSDQRAQSEGQGTARGLSGSGAPATTNSPLADTRAKSAGVSRAARTLTRGADFEVVLQAGSRFASRNFVVRAHLNACTHARLGIIAGRKAASRAVDRNRARRLIREVFRSALERLGPYDVTVQLRGDLRSESNGRVREELGKLLESVVRLAPGSQSVRQ